MPRAKTKAKPNYLHVSKIVGDLRDARDGLARMQAPERKKLTPIINGLLRKQRSEEAKDFPRVSESDMRELERTGA
jgi:hypothetical protein